mmetsp:Transcript_54894/g.49400  ORF Transcript_54894/g.49400 Transcript_54894/m.49400 type:complete len:367 (+) Transcript_54894:27-1127(+)
MTDEAPPPYNEATQSTPPAYIGLQEPLTNDQSQPTEEAAPPPVQFGIVSQPAGYPALNQPAQPSSNQGQQQPVIIQVVQQSQQPIVIQAPPVTNGGETYQHVPTTSGPVYVPDGVGGEARRGNNRYPGNQPAVYYDARGRHGGAAQVRSRMPTTDSPREKLSIKIRDQRVNAFSLGDGACTCCCHLQLAAYLLLFVFVFYNGFAGENYLNEGTYQWFDEKYVIYDICLGIYSFINLIINIVCFVGISRCKSCLIYPQVIALISYLLVIIINTVIHFIEDYEATAFINVLEFIVVLWFIFVFYRVYSWAYYFENGGVFDPNMFKPPKRSEVSMYANVNNPNQDQAAAAAPAQAIQMQPIPQDGGEVR